MHCHRVARQALAKVSPRRCTGRRCLIGTACTEPAAAAGRALCPARALPGWLALRLGLGWGGEGGPSQKLGFDSHSTRDVLARRKLLGLAG